MVLKFLSTKLLNMNLYTPLELLCKGPFALASLAPASLAPSAIHHTHLHYHNFNCVYTEAP